MQDYSLDLQAETIYSSQTKEYFKEVIRSYYGTNYRAAIVTLYSVVIYDLVNKLEVLRDSYADKAATTILAKIDKMQIENPKSPDWESKLIDLVKADTKLLEVADGLHVENLQSLRHLCAHPVRKTNYELFSPNKETVRAHIRNMLEAVLTKRPLLHKAIFDDFVKDISSARYRLLSDENVLDRYISSKYLTNLSFDGVKQIVKSLWKLTFKLDNPDANLNREINLQVLSTIIRKYTNNILESIRNESEYYSNINSKYIREITFLINEHHSIFDILRDSEKDELNARILGSADTYAYAWFKSKSIEAHTDTLQGDEYTVISMTFTENRIDPQTLSYLEKILRSYDSDKANIFVSNMYRKSLSYDTADDRFNNIVSPNLQYFSLENFKLLLSNIEANSQLYERRNAVYDNRIIKSAIERRFPKKIDYADYPTFLRRS